MINFDELIVQHIKWMEFVESLLSEDNNDPLIPAMIVNDSECALGKWINACESDELSSSETFQTLKKVHKEFHINAGLVISNYQAGKLEQACGLLEPFIQSSKQTIELINQLQKEME